MKCNISTVTFQTPRKSFISLDSMRFMHIILIFVKYSQRFLGKSPKINDPWILAHEHQTPTSVAKLATTQYDKYSSVNQSSKICFSDFFSLIHVYGWTRTNQHRVYVYIRKWSIDFCLTSHKWWKFSPIRCSTFTHILLLVFNFITKSHARTESKMK